MELLDILLAVQIGLAVFVVFVWAPTMVYLLTMQFKEGDIESPDDNDAPRRNYAAEIYNHQCGRPKRNQNNISNR